MLEPIDSHLLYREVERRLRSYIVEKGLKPGDRLPTESEIAKSLSVSRPVVREALKAMEGCGLVEIQRGSGIRVAQFSSTGYLRL